MADSSIIREGFDPKFPAFATMDTFIPRKNIFIHIRNSLKDMKGTLLDVGCGYMPYRKFIEDNAGIHKYLGLDLEDATTYKSVKPDLVWNGYDIPLENESVESVMLTEVLEHCPYPDKILQEVFRVLKPGGKVIFSVPFVFYLHETPFDFYRYTPFAIRKMMKDANLRINRLEAYGKNSIAFLHAYFIWLKRGSLPKIIRFGLYIMALPFIFAVLLFAGKSTITEFQDLQMFTGIYGVAEKQSN